MSPARRMPCACRSQRYAESRFHMCRSIKTLRRPEPAVTETEIAAAALQFVRKISGFRKPSKANQPVFDGAVEAVADEVRKLLVALEVQVQ